MIKTKAKILIFIPLTVILALFYANRENIYDIIVPNVYTARIHGNYVNDTMHEYVVSPSAIVENGGKYYVYIVQKNTDYFLEYKSAEKKEIEIIDADSESCAIEFVDFDLDDWGAEYVAMADDLLFSGDSIDIVVKRK
ncbi:MAG: hypothetical protein FWG34_09430 [Oscillospiraceae bacterium]|nr:hypothetical protein [Oscillospiraceae bacterium]